LNASSGNRGAKRDRHQDKTVVEYPPHGFSQEF
jgi:hypothetical protein